MQDTKQQWVKWIQDLQAIAQTGLNYAQDPFDKERYKALREIAAEMAAASQDSFQIPEIIELFAKDMGYATPKLDVRGVVFKENKILMVKEHSDGLWTLPGGWADVNTSAAESVVREIFEESGFKTKALKLLALYDKRKHDHPSQLPHAYKAFFLCEIIGGHAQTSIETTAVDFFEEGNLPDLSVHRVTASEIERFFEHYRNPNWPTDFD